LEIGIHPGFSGSHRLKKLVVVYESSAKVTRGAGSHFNRDADAHCGTVKRTVVLFAGAVKKVIGDGNSWG
jgi:hypothetical protein